MTQATRLPFGTALALAQRVLAAPLAAVLKAEGMAMPVWFTLNALGLQGPSPAEALSSLLATNGLDAPAVRSSWANWPTPGSSTNAQASCH
jgi:hypothetical protein